MRQVFLALILLLAGVLILGTLWLGEFPPKPVTHQVDHTVPLVTTPAMPVVPAAKP